MSDVVVMKNEGKDVPRGWVKPTGRNNGRNNNSTIGDEVMAPTSRKAARKRARVYRGSRDSD